MLKQDDDSKEFKWIARFGAHVWNLQTVAGLKNKQQWQHIHTPRHTDTQNINYAKEA